MTRRYDWAPLAALVGTCVSRKLNVSGSTLQEYQRRGVTPRVADRLATKAGFHPAEVWPTWFDDAEADRRVRHAERMRRRRATAKGRAENLEAIRRYRESLTPAALEAIRVKDREYKAANRERINAAQRERDRRARDERNSARRERYRTDPAYRERVLEAQRRRDRARAVAS